MRSASKPFSFYSTKPEEPDGDQALSLLLKGQADDFKELMSRYPQLINTKDRQHGNVPLHVASSKGDLAMVSFLLSRGAETNVQDIFGNGPLHYAIDKGKRAVAEALLNSGANSNMQDYRGNSPLHVACTNNDVDSVKLLLKFNADPDMPDMQDVKPREKANSPLIRSLIDRRIHALHGGEAEQANQSIQWMSMGVGLGVGLGVALAKYQQAMIEHQLNIRMDAASKQRKRGNFSSVASFKPMEEGTFVPGSAPASQMMMLPSHQVPGTASQSFMGEQPPSSSGGMQRKFFS